MLDPCADTFAAGKDFPLPPNHRQFVVRKVPRCLSQSLAVVLKEFSKQVLSNYSDTEDGG